MKRIITLCFFLLGLTNLYCRQSISLGQINKDSVYSMVDSAPKFIQGDVYKWLGEHIVYPPSAVAKGIEGTVYISFVVEKDGSVSTVKLLRGVDTSINKEALRVASQMPAWSAGKIKDETVRTKLMLPVKFKLINYADTGKIYTSAEQVPKFSDDFDVWVAENIAYKKKTSGIVYLDIIIEKNGNVTNPKILHGASSSDSVIMGKEALRLAKIMPKWVPAYQDGKPVRFEAAVAIKFNIMDAQTLIKIDQVFCDTCVQVRPTFSEELVDYFHEHIAWSQAALRNHAQGKVTVSFIIEKNSSLSNIQVVSYDPGAEMLLLDAKRVIREMTDNNKWTPGYQDGKPVRVRKVVTIHYVMGPDQATYKVYKFDTQ